MRTIVALLVAVLGTAAAAHAQIAPCSAVNDTSWMRTSSRFRPSSVWI